MPQNIIIKCHEKSVNDSNKIVDRNEKIIAHQEKTMTINDKIAMRNGKSTASNGKSATRHASIERFSEKNAPAKPSNLVSWPSHTCYEKIKPKSRATPIMHTDYDVNTWDNYERTIPLTSKPAITIFAFRKWDIYGNSRVAFS